VAYDRHAQGLLFTGRQKTTDPAKCCAVCRNYYAAAFVRGFCPVLRENVDGDDVCPYFRSYATTGRAQEREKGGHDGLR